MPLPCAEAAVGQPTQEAPMAGHRAQHHPTQGERLDGSARVILLLPAWPTLPGWERWARPGLSAELQEGAAEGEKEAQGRGTALL